MSYVDTMKSIKCAFCNEELVRIPSRIIKYNNHFCDRKCQAEFYRESMK